MKTADFLQGELERLFELDSMLSLSKELLGLDPSEVGGTGAKGTYARALVNHFAQDNALDALAEAISLANPRVPADLKQQLSEQRDEDFKPGAEVGGFRILKRLSRGANGTVYLCERRAPDNGHTERGALKVFEPHLSQDRGALWRFVANARALRQVRDPGLAGIYDAGILPDGRAWVVSEHIAGQTLAGRLGRTGAVHFNELRPVSRAFLRGLQLLHDKQLLHGSIKPENLFMVRPPLIEGQERPQPYGVLSDCAAAKLLERKADGLTPNVMRIVGPAAYVAPEVAMGRAPDVRSEIYTAACVLYHALAGRPPFEGESDIDVLHAHVHEQAKGPSHYAPRNWVPEELDGIMLHALCKDPDERFQTANEFADSLDNMGKSIFPPAADEALDIGELYKTVALFQNSPEDEALATQLEALVAPSREWGQAVDAFTTAAQETEDLALRKQLLLRSARILEDEIKDGEQAESMYQAILAIDPQDAQAASSIEELRRERGDHEGVIELMLDRLENEQDRDDRASILREVATMYEDALRSPENAFVAWCQALGEDPDDERAVRSVERLAQTPEQWQEAINTLNETAQQSEQPRQQLHLYVRMARWYMKHLRRLDFALPYLQHALQIDPAHGPALEAMTDLYRDAQSWNELVQMLLHRSDSASNPAHARDLKSEAALVVAMDLGDVARAEVLFEEILADDPAHPQATEALETLYGSTQQWGRMAELLQTKANEQRGEAKAATLCELAELFEDRLDDLDQAKETFESAVNVDKRSLVALKGLERICARRSDYEGLQANLERQLSVAATPGQRTSLLERLGALAEEEMGDPKAAVDRYEQVIELSPGHDTANAALARLYREMHRFDELAQTLDRHAKSVDDSDRKVELLMQAARVLMADVGSPDRAAFVLDRVLGLVPEHAEALELSARLKTLAGDKVAAVDTLELLADTEQDPSKKAELWVRAGKMLEEQNDLDGALDRYRMSLDSIADYAPATDAMRSVYERRSDAQGLSELLLREVEQAEDTAQRSQLLVQLGQLRLTRLKDKSLAQDAFEQARALDAENLQASLGLGQLALERGQWQQAADLLSPLLARTTDLETEVALSVCLGVGDAYRALEDNEQAQRGYLNAKALDPNNREVLERLGQLAYDTGAHDEAAALFGDLLDKFKTQLSAAERGALLLKVGRAELKMDDVPGAVASLTNATEFLPDATEPLDALLEAQKRMENWEAVARVLRRRMDLALDDDERFEMWVEVGDVFAQKLDDRGKAQKAYVAALQLRGDDRNLLTKLMAVYSEDKDWGRLVDVLVKMTSLVDEEHLRAKYFNTAAHVCHTELKNIKKAIELYQKALYIDAANDSAFKGITDCLTRMSDWEGLAKAYQSYIPAARDSLDAEQLAPMYDSLAELLHLRLKRTDDAVAAHEAAHELDPDNRWRIEKLTEIYAKHPSRYAERAIGAHALLLKQNPYRAESYQALRKLYTQVQRPDEAWCACQALRNLNMAEPEEEAFFKRHRTQKPATAQECFSEDFWQRFILHPEQDPLLTAIFAAVQPAAIAEIGQPLQNLGVDPAKPLNPQQDNIMLGQMLQYASGVTLVQCPPIYHREQDPGGISHLFSNPPCIGLGQGALQGGPDQALAFLSGRQLSYYRPGHYMRALVPTGSGLRGWLLAAIRVANPRFPVPGKLQQAVEQNHAALQRHLQGPQLTGIKSLAEHLLREAPELDMKRWSAAVDLTADRVGFVLADSLEAGVAVVRASPADSSSASERDRLKELYLYAVSSEYLALRKASGIAIA